MNVGRPPGRTRVVDMAVVAWVAVLGGTIALGLAGGETSGPVTAISAVPGRPSPTPSAVTRVPPRAPLPSRPPIGEDGVMGGLPFGTAWQWLEAD